MVTKYEVQKNVSKQINHKIKNMNYFFIFQDLIFT